MIKQRKAYCKQLNPHSLSKIHTNKQNVEGEHKTQKAGGVSFKGQLFRFVRELAATIEGGIGSLLCFSMRFVLQTRASQTENFMDGTGPKRWRVGGRDGRCGFHNQTQSFQP